MCKKRPTICSFAGLFLAGGLLFTQLLAGGTPTALAYGLASISITDSSLVEGDSGSSNMIFTVTRTATQTQPWSSPTKP